MALMNRLTVDQLKGRAPISDAQIFGTQVRALFESV